MEVGSNAVDLATGEFTMYLPEITAALKVWRMDDKTAGAEEHCAGPGAPVRPEWGMRKELKARTYTPWDQCGRRGLYSCVLTV